MLMGVLPRRSKAAGGALLPLALRLLIFAAGSILSFWVSLHSLRCCTSSEQW
jgi:hypothetical protein